MKLELSKITDAQPQREHGDIGDLKESIKRLGLLQPLVVTPEYSLVAGRRRYQALMELGITEAPVHIVNPKDDYIKFLMALDENLKRKEMSWQEIVFCEKEEKRIYEEVYGDTEENRKKRSIPKEGSAESAAPPPYTKAKAEALGVSERKIQEEIQLAEAIEENPELKDIRTKQGALRHLKIKAQIAQLEENPPEKPTGLYDVIAIDPPWEMEGNYDPLNRRGIPPYPTMTTEAIKSLKIPATDNAVLWLWVINRKMKFVYEILDAWGFEERNILTWVKDKFGVGDWLRNQTEHCILAIKGKPVFLGQKDTTVLHGKRTTHSTKPEEFYQLVERTCRGRKLDFFSRQNRQGWDAFGDEHN